MHVERESAREVQDDRMIDITNILFMYIQTSGHASSVDVSSRLHVIANEKASLLRKLEPVGHVVRGVLTVTGQFLPTQMRIVMISSQGTFHSIVLDKLLFSED